MREPISACTFPTTAALHGAFMEKGCRRLRCPTLRFRKSFTCCGSPRMALAGGRLQLCPRQGETYRNCDFEVPVRGLLEGAASAAPRWVKLTRLLQRPPTFSS